MEPGNSGLTRQHTSDMLGAPTLLAGPREATRQSSGTEPKVAEGGSRGSEPPECQLWGGLPQEELPLKGAQSKERQGGEEGLISERKAMRMMPATAPIATCHWEPTLRQVPCWILCRKTSQQFYEEDMITTI